MINRREEGFTLVELMITMVVFVFVIAGASQVFTALLTQFKQQNKMAETHIEGAVGLNILRRDIEHAGYGLPWVIPPGVAYKEAYVIDTPVDTPWVDRDLNDGPEDNPARGSEAANTLHPPGAIRSLNDKYNAVSWTECVPAGPNCSDVLTIKSVNVAMNDISQAWTHLDFLNAKENGLSGESFDGSAADTDRVTVLSPGTSDVNRRSLVVYTDPVSGAKSWFTTFNNTANFKPPNVGQTYVVYGIRRGGDPLMPFNRADYYIRRPASGMPPACAPNTGILYKAVLAHIDNGGHGSTTLTEYPLMSCVANLQVVYNMNGVWTNDISSSTAANLRAQLREVRVYILAQEGQKDRNYTHRVSDDDKAMCGGSETAIYVGDRNIGLGQCFDFTDAYKNYRWRLYNLVIQPANL
jgi:prepilin-type N-terminal cleavage/methylation domain-containing protein